MIIENISTLQEALIEEDRQGLLLKPLYCKRKNISSRKETYDRYYQNIKNKRIPEKCSKCNKMILSTNMKRHKKGNGCN